MVATLPGATRTDRLRAMLNDTERPVQFLFAGKAHPADRDGQEVIRRIVSLTQGEFHGKLVFIEDYDIGVGRALVQGCDVWLNNPTRTLEASGTDLSWSDYSIAKLTVEAAVSPAQALTMS